jgi:hypothetical protein
MDAHMTWSQHITHVLTKICVFSGIFAKLRHTFSPIILRNLYYTFIYPHLTYNLEVWGQACATHLHPLIVMHKKIMRIISFADFREHTKPLFVLYQILDFNSLIKLQTLLFTHSMLYNNFKPYDFIFEYPEHCYSTRFVQQSKLKPHLANTSCKQNLSLRVKGPKLWNELPCNTRKIVSASIFKNSIVEILFGLLSD